MENYIYWDLAAKLAWNPNKVNVNDFLTDYAVRRYGESDHQVMVQAFKELVKSSYGANRFSPNVRYMCANTELIDPENESIKAYVGDLPFLKNALDTMLRVSALQDSNPLYRQDLVDVAVQYLNNSFDLHLSKACRAVKEEKVDEFESQAKICKKLMDKQAALLASFAPYRIGTELERANRLPYVRPNVGNSVRARYTFLGYLTLRAQYPAVLDYAARNMYELVKYYYRPRMEVYLNALRNMLHNNSNEFPKAEVEKAYERITMEWINGPLDVVWTGKTQGNTVALVKSIAKDTY